MQTPCLTPTGFALGSQFFHNWDISMDGATIDRSKIMPKRFLSNKGLTNILELIFLGILSLN